MKVRLREVLEFALEAAAHFLSAIAWSRGDTWLRTVGLSLLGGGLWSKMGLFD